MSQQPTDIVSVSFGPEVVKGCVMSTHETKRSVSWAGEKAATESETKVKGAVRAPMRFLCGVRFANRHGYNVKSRPASQAGSRAGFPEPSEPL
jgi:hypothetical protein